MLDAALTHFTIPGMHLRMLLAPMPRRVRQQLRLQKLRTRDKDEIGWNLGQLAYFIYTQYSQVGSSALYVPGARVGCVFDLRSASQDTLRLHVGVQSVLSPKTSIYTVLCQR